MVFLPSSALPWACMLVALLTGNHSSRCWSSRWSCGHAGAEAGDGRPNRAAPVRGEQDNLHPALGGAFLTDTPIPADLQHLWLWDGDQLVGKLGYQVCDSCQQGLICQISLYEAAYRNVGLGRRVIRRAQEQLAPDAAWWTSGQNPQARRFWRRMRLEMALGSQPCAHMKRALDG